MSKSTQKAEVIPVKKEKAAERSLTHLLTPFEEMERWAENFFPTNWFQPQRMPWPSTKMLSSAFEGRIPKVDIIDRDEEILIKAELPGIDKKDVDVSMTGNTITIKGSSSKEEKEEKGEYYRCEISRGSFSRSMTLPSDVDIDKSEAKFADGVLELTLPKVERARRKSLKIH